MNKEVPFHTLEIATVLIRLFVCRHNILFRRNMSKGCIHLSKILKRLESYYFIIIGRII